MQKYLANSEIIDWNNPDILAKAQELAKDCASSNEIAKSCFEFVRDEIHHSWDYKLNPVTCKASQVLEFKTGYCYAKSHLLAALLRANRIPTGLCYQRLKVTSEESRFCLHGLNAIFLEGFGWYRVDARGNKNGVDAKFLPPQEYLAFKITDDGELDFPEIWIEPLPIVIQALTTNQTYLEVYQNLPDVKVLPANQRLKLTG